MLIVASNISSVISGQCISNIIIPVSILNKSIMGRYRPVREADEPIMARYRFM